MSKKYLIKLNKDKILKSNNKKRANTLLTIALIRNDISDLVYLQGLFASDNKNIKNEVSAESGQYAGRRIYFMRVFLSHYFEFLMFLYKRKKDIENDMELQVILKNLSKDNLKIWKNFNLLADTIESKEKYKENNNIEYKVLILAESVRSELTFHYWHASSYLSNGFKRAFIEDDTNPHNKHPIATELFDLNKDRSYYIDLAIERYLENKVSLDKDIFIFENEIINIVANVNLILSVILNKYHNNIKIK